MCARTLTCATPLKPPKPRPNVRDTGVWSRSVAKTAADRLSEIKVYRAGVAVVGIAAPGILAAAGHPSRRLAGMAMLAGLLILSQVVRMRQRRPYNRPALNGRWKVLVVADILDEIALLRHFRN